MKIAISSDKNNINGNIAENFGRCSYFLFVEIEDGKITGFEVVKNKNKDQTSGVGVSVAQMVVEKKANAVLAGAVGPRASEVLIQFGLQIYKASGSIEEALQKFFK